MSNLVEVVQEDRRDLDLANRRINMSNALARAAHDLKFVGKRLLTMALAMNDFKASPEKVSLFAASGWVVRLKAQDVAAITGMSLNSAYEALAEGAKDLFEAEIRIIKESSKKKGTAYDTLRWVTRASYRPGEAYVEIEFTPNVAPHLLNLSGQFSTYRLKQALELRTLYSWRLFECLQSWKKTGLWLVSIEDFCHALEVPESYRSNFKFIRTRVIEPSVEELIKSTPYDVQCKAVKTGRRVSNLEFTFRRKEQQQGKLPLDEEKTDGSGAEF